MQFLLGSLPFLTTFLWSSVFYFRLPATARSLRWSLALGCISLGSFTLTITESLSPTHLLHRGPVLGVWIAALLIPLFLLWQRRKSIHTYKEIDRIRKKLLRLPRWLLLTLTFTFLLIIVMAIFTPPMNFDVQIYHLPRQIFWMMQGSVVSFPATHTHQISMPVLSEEIGLNLLLLSGTDFLHNLVQTLFMLAACGLVSLIVSDLGGNARAQGLSVLTILLVPAAFFEASNAKNDIILSLFVLLPLAVGLRLWSGKELPSLFFLLLACLSAGLAIATKGTAVVYLLPSAVLITVAYVRLHGERTLLMALLPGLLLVILPPLPQILRNEALFHSPAGPNLHHANLSHYPGDVMNVVIRNIAGQFTFDSDAWNNGLETSTRTILGFLNLDPDDPATTFEGQKFHLPYFAGLEDIVPAPVQTILLLCLPLSLIFTSLRYRPGLLPLLLCTFGALLLFCMMFRWQPWQGRLLIPGYFIAAPMIGLVLDLLRPAWIPLVVTLAEIFSLRPHLMFSGQRPLFGGASIFRMSREDQMSRMMPGRAIELRTLLSTLSKSSPSAIQIDGGATEIYGLLKILRTGLPKTLLRSGPVERPSSDHPWIIQSTTHDAGAVHPPRNPNPLSPKDYKVFWVGDYYRIFIPVTATPKSSS